MRKTLIIAATFGLGSVVAAASANAGSGCSIQPDLVSWDLPAGSVSIAVNGKVVASNQGNKGSVKLPDNAANSLVIVKMAGQVVCSSK
jgi:hypothetical protein